MQTAINWKQFYSTNSYISKLIIYDNMQHSMFMVLHVLLLSFEWMVQKMNVSWRECGYVLFICCFDYVEKCKFCG